MTLSKQTLRYLLPGIVMSTLLVAGTTQADEAQRERAPGYVTDSDGTIMRDGSGECMHSGSWTPKMATVVGCDGVVLNAPVATLKGGGTGQGVAFVIPAASMFAFDKADLTDQGKKDLEAYRAKIRPELAEAFAAVIVGYTDNKGDPKYNVELSKRRADAVRDFLIAGGAPANKLRTVGMGAKDPIAPNDTDTGRAENRRVEVMVFGEARALDVMLFPSVAMFDRKSSQLTMRGKQMLEKNEQEAREKLTRAVYIEVIGHADDVGDPKENQKLSEQRARAVSESLIKSGVDPNKIAVVGVGSSQPIASNQTPEGRADNRRVEVLVLGRLKEK